MPNINPKTTLLPEPAWIPQGEREEVPVVLPGPGRYNYRALPRRPVNQGFLFFAWRLDFPAPRGLTEWVPPEFCPNYYYHHRLCLYFWSQNRTPQKRFPEPPTSPPQQSGFRLPAPSTGEDAIPSTVPIAGMPPRHRQVCSTPVVHRNCSAW